MDFAVALLAGFLNEAAQLGGAGDGVEGELGAFVLGEMGFELGWGELSEQDAACAGGECGETRAEVDAVGHGLACHAVLAGSGDDDGLLAIEHCY
jgi:hypothetical protein